MTGKLYVISGSSGVGKGTVIKEFLSRHPEFKLSVSCTTRQPRAGETDGVHYFFLSKEEFQSNVDNDAFLEWAEFSGNKYGTQKKYVEKKLKEIRRRVKRTDVSEMPSSWHEAAKAILFGVPQVAPVPKEPSLWDFVKLPEQKGRSY